MAESNLLVVKHLSVTYRRRGRLLHRTRAAADLEQAAVSGVSFTLGRGENLAIVGESGSGKTSLAHAILRLVEPRSGSVIFDGENVLTMTRKSLRAMRRRIQVIYQDPYEALDPRFRVRAAVEEPLLVHKIGNSKRERDDRVAEVMTQVDLVPPRMYLDRYPHELSGGQRQRVAIAASLILDPDVLVADEPVSMLDVSIRVGILDLLDRLRIERGLAVLMITHDLSMVAHVADRIGVMYGGRLVELGPSQEVIATPYHPYTRALVNAIPRLGSRMMEGELRSSRTAAPVSSPGCPLEPRCPNALPHCRVEMPRLVAVEADLSHVCACHVTAPSPVLGQSRAPFTCGPAEDANVSG
jgi:peptide/nickel transport system ATP-binding protein